MSTMARGVFVTGTDTGVGKTVAAVALLRGLVREGLKGVGMKPVAAGLPAAGGPNEDVVALQAAGNVCVPLADRNPYALADPVAPHLAARREGIVLDLDVIAAAHARLGAAADVVVVEGAGGPLVPLDEHRDMLDIARRLRLPVLLVVGIRLGCLSHARMSALAIGARGLRLAGWVASRVDPAMPLADENVAWLARELPAPCVADLRADPAPPFDGDALRTLGLA
jgi:dethiobiotin synthetase